MIRELPEGYHVRYRHRRSTAEDGTVLPRGGTTIALVYDAADRLIAEGVAQCNTKDNYSRKLGRTIALGRALVSS